METGAFERGGVQREVGMEVAKYHVADVGRIDAELCQQRKDPLAASDHAGIHDDDSAFVADQHDGAGHPLSSKKPATGTSQ